MDNALIDLSDAKTVAGLLASCGLPVTPFTAYVLKDTMRGYAAERIKNMSVAELRNRFPGAANVDPTALLDRLFPYVAKDVDVLEYNLGRPVSVAEANRVFIEAKVDLDKVPKDQRDLVNTQANTVTDVITLQETPLSEFVQLRVTGELVTRETFRELVERGTTRWMGKESVGFKTPGMGAILGNLVSFNFDHQDFFPQAPGTLSIRTVPNVSKTPSQTRPARVVPKQFFRLEYRDHVSFLPDTPEGRIVLGLMKDAFKKGNLYALSWKGRVRHGRVHKKTSISGTSHSYPDDTYLQRVSGELSALGSSAFLYQFSEDPTYSPFVDPYPLEERFFIR